MKILYVSAHPDDECDNAGGTLAKLSKHNDIYIIYFTDGRLGSPYPEERGDKLALIRKKEAMEGLKVLGIDPNKAYFLEYPDGELSKFISDAVKKVIPILQNISPNVIFYPSTFDAHPDHWAAGKIMKEAIHEARIQADQLSYLNWEPKISRNLKITLRYLEWKISMKKAIYVNIEEFMDVKFEAIKKHESQIKYFDNQYIEKFFKSKYERFYVEKSYSNLKEIIS
jgi:LmbE family N-acetylglucosaminyl deacetylase